MRLGKGFLSALLVLTLSFAAAQADEFVWQPTDFALALAIEVDGVYGCAIQDAVRQGGGDCFMLDVSIATARQLIGNQLSRYSDVEPTTPWASEGDSYFRFYRIDGRVVMVALLKASAYSTLVAVTIPGQ